MRYTQKCPKCEGQRFAVAELRDPRTDQPLSVVSFWGAEPAMVEPRRLQVHGSFESWICLTCGYAEFYARDCSLPFEMIAQQHPDRLRIVDARPPEKGPYR
jgi:predicted nucleic-acid-binding Zn-ribbon protein